MPWRSIGSNYNSSNAPDTRRLAVGLDNLPYGVFSVGGGPPRVGVRVTDIGIDLATTLGDEVFAASSLDPFMATGPANWSPGAGADHRAGGGCRAAGWTRCTR